MSSRAKNAIYSVVLLIAVLAVWYWRKSDEPIKIEGKTMGTTYHITYFDSEKRNFKNEIDSILVLVNKSISTYDTTSEISRFNRAAHSLRFSLPYFLTPLKVSQQVVSASQGAFDPTVMPLVNAWGFGPQKVTNPDTAIIEKVKEYIGFEKLNFNQDSVWKIDPRVQLDFSGIGQGYGADVITDYLKSKGIENALVEVGGEGMAIGINIQSKKPWRLGIVDPVQPETFKGYVNLENKSFSTSGNYFNYRVVNGRRYSHTIDPMTGYPTERPILSVSVFASTCTLADAWATAIMCMGHERAIEVLKSHPELGVCLFYTSESGEVMRYATENMNSYLSFEENK
jgi:thiamine biosynthesis lipoprotein